MLFNPSGAPVFGEKTVRASNTHRSRHPEIIAMHCLVTSPELSFQRARRSCWKVSLILSHPCPGSITGLYMVTAR